jgi:hypothetical protein
MLKQYPFLAGVFYANAVFITIDNLKRSKAVINFLAPFNFVFLGFFQNHFYTNSFWSKYIQNKPSYLTNHDVFLTSIPAVNSLALRPLLAMNNISFTILKNTLQKLLTNDNTKSVN